MSKKLHDQHLIDIQHRRNSDIMREYGTVRRIRHVDQLPAKLPPGVLPPDPKFQMNRKTHPDIMALVANKTNLMAWFSSHCDTLSNRQEYIDELERYIPIHTYGYCGTRQCQPWNGEECFQMLNRYKFHMSAENNLCNFLYYR